MAKQAGIAYEDRGGGDVTLLLVHGWQGDRSVWDGVVAELGPGVRTIAVDLPGFGGSSTLTGPYNLDRFAAELRALLESLGTGPVVAVGHSMGAKVALRLAIEAPAMVRGLVLVAPVPIGPAGFSEKGQAYLRATAGDPVRLRAWLAKTIADPPDDATLDRLCAIAAKSPPGAVLECLEAWMHADLAEPAKRVVAPAVVIASAQDAPERAHSNVAALLPDARFVVVPDAAHYAILERPGAIASHIGDFVAALPKDGDRHE
ncbi:MAG TPA: alpha/beta fold hydrolase [Candidatus Cybelea sp.]